MQKLITCISLLFVLSTAYAGQWVVYRGTIPKHAVVAKQGFGGELLYKCRGYLAFYNKYEEGVIKAGSNTCKKGAAIIPGKIEIYVQRPRHQDYACITTKTGTVCGYGCVQTIKGARCAPKRNQLCLADERGDIACGYNCLASNKEVRCAKTEDGNCVKDNFGNVQCGVNCRIQGRRVVCGN